MDTWAPIDTPMALESGFDLARKFSIFSAALAGFAFAPGVESAHGYLKRTTHHRHSILLLMRSHELILQSWLREKMLLASDRISPNP